MALPASDSFTYSNGNLTTVSSSWSMLTGSNIYFVVSSNQLTLPGPSSQNACYWNADTFAADQYSRVQIVTTPTTGMNQGVCVRAQAGPSLYYLAIINGTSWKFEKIVGGTTTAIGSAQSYAFSLNDTVELRVVGSTLYCYINGVRQSYTQTDTSITSGGSAGLYVYSGSAGNGDFDNWVGGNVDTTVYDPITACFPIGYYE